MEPGLEGGLESREEQQKPRRMSEQDRLSAQQDLLLAGCRPSLLEDDNILRAYALGWNASRKHWDEGFTSWVDRLGSVEILPALLSLVLMAGSWVTALYYAIRYADNLGLGIACVMSIAFSWQTMATASLGKFLYRRLCNRKPEEMKVQEGTTKS